MPNIFYILYPDHQASRESKEYKAQLEQLAIMVLLVLLVPQVGAHLESQGPWELPEPLVHLEARHGDVDKRKV